MSVVLLRRISEFSILIQVCVHVVFTGKISVVSHEPGVVAGSDVIVMVLPAMYHAMYFELMLPFITPGTEIGVLAGHAGADWTAREALGDTIFDR